MNRWNTRSDNGIKNGMGIDMSVTVYKEVEVDVDIEDFDTVDLMAELQSRGVDTGGLDNVMQNLQHIYELRKMNKPYEQELDAYIYDVLGKII